MTRIPHKTLNDGTTIPQLGFGVAQIDPAQTAKVVRAAVEAGYRHFDTAAMYGNEFEVAAGLRESGIARDDVYITSKLNNDAHGVEEARKAFHASLSQLAVDYVDLYLIHWPLPTLYEGDFVSTWETLLEIKSSGLAKSVGVSNFQPAHLERLAAETDVVPAVNQVELHPYFGNPDVSAYNAERQITTEAWSPIAQGLVLNDSIIGQIAKRVGKSSAQVVLRWHLQRGHVVFPKSVTVRRIRENIDLFDFELSDADVAVITGLDKGEDGRTGPHPDTFDLVP